MKKNIGHWHRHATFHIMTPMMAGFTASFAAGYDA
jgi:hypothetical protein